MWFCVVSCHILWFTFTKAIFNVIKKKITGVRCLGVYWVWFMLGSLLLSGAPVCELFRAAM